MDYPISEINKLCKIKKLFKKEKGCFITIEHCIIPLYNPYTKMYREWDINKPTEWIVKIRNADKTKHEIIIFFKYKDIEKIAMYINNLTKN